MPMTLSRFYLVVQPMLIELSELIGLYLPVLIGCIAQTVFLLLPVNLRNWSDDFINVLTYAGIQVFAACLVFVALPRMSSMFHLSDRGSFFLLLTVFLASWVRALKLIPLEATSPVSRKYEPQPRLQFSEFFEPERLRMLAEISENDPHSSRASQSVREKLRRRKAEKSEGPMILGDAA